jgi:hypothetical protein
MAPYVVLDPRSWLYDGLSVKVGTQIPGVIMSDIDHVAHGAGTPANFHVMGHSRVPLGVMTTNQGTWGGFTYADTGYFTLAKSHAGVFDSGTVNWISSITRCRPGLCPAPMVAAMTGNLLRVFGQGPVGTIAPSQSNYGSVTPLGS